MSNQEITVVESIEISHSIFRNYDIRGVADSDPLEPGVNRPLDLTARQAWLIGKAYGTWLMRNSGRRLVVGRDNRRTSVDLASGFITGVLSTGCQVVDIGLSTSPLLYFSVEELHCDGGLMVTGSHNPMWSNGLKLCKRNYQTLVSEEIQGLLQIIRSKDFSVGTGSYSEDSAARENYLAAIRSRVRPATKRLRVVVDTGNATGGLFGIRLLEDLGHEIIPLNSELEYPFPKGAPDPEQPGKLVELGNKVREVSADVGIAYDGDADRLGVMDEKGIKLESDLLLLLLARDVLREHPGAEIVFDVKCSDLLVEDIERRGGVPVMWKTGHSNIKQKMSEDAASGKSPLLGGELSGHIFIRDRFFGFDDALYASCRVLEILASGDATISGLLSDLPPLKTTRELALPCPDDQKASVVEKATATLRSKGFEINDIDGARVSFGTNKWALVRVSNTQPKLTARFQATNMHDLEEIVAIVRSVLIPFKAVDLQDLDAGLKEVD